MKTWLVRYFIDAKERQFTLLQIYGQVIDSEHINLADARLLTAKIKVLSRQGIDYAQQLLDSRAAAIKLKEDRIAAERVATEQALKDNLTLSDMADAWLSEGVRRQDGNAQLRRSFLRKTSFL